MNSKDFIITVIQNNKNKYKLSFLYTYKSISLEIKPYPLIVINFYYKKIFNIKTKYFYMAIIDFKNKNIIQQLLEKVEFYLIFFWIKKFLIIILSLNYLFKNRYYKIKIEFVSFFII